MNQRPINSNRSARAPNIQRGFTLVELMISLVLGLVVIGGVISVFLANQQSYRTNQALAEVQDSSRTAFEFLARDIRQAGLTGCGNTNRVANVLKKNPASGSSYWWADFNNAVHGYDGNQADPGITIGTNTTERVANTDSIQIIRASDTQLTVTEQQANAANFKVNVAGSQIPDGAIIIVCDPSQATILQVNKGNENNKTVEYSAGGSQTPGNCSKGLGFPTDCGSTNGNAYPYGVNSSIATLSSIDWYIGNNSVGGRSLYQVGLSGGVTGAPQEMVRNVTGMDLMYHLAGGTGFVDAAGVGSNWDQVDAVQITLIVQSADQRAGTDIQPLTRSFTTTVTLRNRVN